MQHVAPSRFRRFIGYPALDAVEWLDLRRWPSALQLLGADVAEFLRNPVLRRLTQVHGLSREALAELAPHELKLESIAIDDDPDGIVLPPRGTLALAVERLCFSNPDDDGAMVGWLQTAGRWALELATEVTMASTSYEAFQLLEFVPASVKRVGMARAHAERSGDAWVLHLDPDEHLRSAHWPGGEDQRLQPVEDLLLDRRGFFSMVVVEGADYGPEIAERIERMSPEIPKRFDWKGAPPDRIPLYRGDDAPF